MKRCRLGDNGLDISKQKDDKMHLLVDKDEKHISTMRSIDGNLLNPRP